MSNVFEVQNSFTYKLLAKTNRKRLKFLGEADKRLQHQCHLPLVNGKKIKIGAKSICFEMLVVNLFRLSSAELLQKFNENIGKQRHSLIRLFPLSTSTLFHFERFGPKNLFQVSKHR